MMKIYQNVAGSLLALPLSLYAANEMAPCTHSCFDDHMSCEKSAENASVLANNECAKEFSACRMSCGSGKKMESYHKLGSMQYSFRPILEDLL